MLNAIKRLTGWPWFVRRETAKPDHNWQNHPWYLKTRLVVVDHEIGEAKQELAEAIKNRRARKHLYAKLESLTTERLRIERGL